MKQEFTISTREHTDFVDITARVEETVHSAKTQDGICVVFVAHTTAGVTISENADPSVPRDLEDALERAVPWNAGYAHAEGNSAAHVKASLMGFSVTIPVIGGGLRLGAWQGIFLVEFDGPRRRKVLVTVLPAA